MIQPSLYLVDSQGTDVSEEIAAAVNSAFRWAIRAFHLVDPVLIENWAEEVGKSMQAKAASIQSPRRYAYAALRGKILDWRKTKPSQEILVGMGSELEKWAGIDWTPERLLDRTILFDQLKTKLSERDRHILLLLQQDLTSPSDVAAALGVNYAAAAKAIQRVKERIAAILAGNPNVQDQDAPHLCGTNG